MLRGEVSHALSKQLLHGSVVLPVEDAKLVKANVCVCGVCMSVCAWCVCVCGVCMSVCVVCVWCVCGVCVSVCVVCVCEGERGGSERQQVIVGEGWGITQKGNPSRHEETLPTKNTCTKCNNRKLFGG